MLRDNLAGLIEPKLNSAGAYPLALGTDRKESSDDRPHHALKIPARQGGIYALTENVASPFHAEPRQPIEPGSRPQIAIAEMGGGAFHHYIRQVPG
jgi:hypothetical protein